MKNKNKLRIEQKKQWNLPFLYITNERRQLVGMYAIKLLIKYHIKMLKSILF